MASHELRTPLQCMLGLMDLLTRSPLDGDQRRLVEAATSIGRSLVDVVDDVLDLSRLEAGAMHLQSAPFAPRELVDAVTTMFGEMARSRGTTLHASVHPLVPLRLRADAGRLRQILVNLIGNALKFTERGTVTVVVGVTPRDGGVILRLDVSDTGPGIPSDKVARLFDAYTTSSEHTRGGSGLGLAISRRFARAMRGDVTVASTPGHGSTFTLSVPCAIDEAPLAVVEPPRAREVRPLRVLLAEDDRVSQYILTRHFEDLDCTIDVVDDGVAALTAFSGGSYDLVLLDCQMPVLDGPAAARAMRAIAREQQVPIIAVTNSDCGHERERCLAAGMDAYMDKPLELTAVAALLDEWCPL